MNDFIQALEKTNVSKGGIAVVWLGQAGFMIKNANNLVVTIDPYLSDCAEREFGFKRLSAAVITPELLSTDVLIATHEHLDHFDVDAMPVLIQNTRKKIVCSPAAAAECKKLSGDNEKLVALSEGEKVSVDGTVFTAVYADHGDLAPDSIGVLIDSGDFSIYYSSDTAYRPDEIAESLGCIPDLAILPINGMYGNLDAYEAAKLADRLKIKTVIPCHFWTFKEHNGENGDPLSFETAMKKHCEKGKPIFLTPGEIIIIGKEV
jgi:L-ascorbate 6-phosphate lactonase